MLSRIDSFFPIPTNYGAGYDPIPYEHLNTSEDLLEVDGRVEAHSGRLAKDWKIQIRLCVSRVDML